MGNVKVDIKNKAIRLLALVLVAIFFIFTLSPLTANAERTYKQKVIRVAYNIQEGLTELDNSGNYSGYSYEYLIKIAQFTGWKYEFVEVEGKRGSEDILAAMDMVKTGKVDLMGGMLKNDTLVQDYEYPQKNYGVVYSNLSSIEGYTDLSETNYMLCDPLRIAILKNATTRNGELEQFLKASGINYNFIEFDDQETQYNAVHNDVADVMSGITLSKVEDTRQLIKFAPRPYYFITKKGNTEITNAIDDAIEKINETDPYYETRLFEKYFGNSGAKFYLSDEEKEYISNKKEINVLVLPQLAPFSFLNGQNEVCGMSRTILNEIGNDIGVKINYSVLADKSAAQREISSGKYDVVFGMEGKDTVATEYGLVLSRPYLDVGLSFFYNQSALNKKNSDSVLAVTRGTKILQSVEYKKIKRYPTIEASMQAVNSGEADFGYANSYSIDFYNMKNRLSNIQTIPISEQLESIGFAVTNSENIELLAILNKNIRTLTGKHLDSHLLRAVSTLNRGTMEEFVKANTPFAVMLIGLFLLAVVSTIFLAYINVVNKKKNIQLSDAYAAAERADKAKTEFLSRMSHEMRTPLSAVISMTGLARESMGNELLVADNLDKIDVASKHLLNLINDVLDMTKINAGKLSLRNAPFDFKSLMTSVEIVYKEYAREKGIDMNFVIDDKLCHHMQGDALRIKQIIINLVSNAIKYNVKGGTASISVVVLAQDGEKQTIRISVRDTGVGIPMARQVAIFKSFERETFADETAIEGTGLGLSISQKIAKLMGTEIKVESSPTSGSMFYLDITLTKAAENACESIQIPVTPLDLTGKTFMVVDDNKINVLILQNMLVKLGAEVDTAQDGKEAAEKFFASRESLYNGIFMDIRMPVLDGYEATRMIRNFKREDADKVVIVAVSANAFTEDMERSLACGMNGHLAKPIDSAALYKTLYDIV